ncbi:MAG: hypothetical protein ACI4MQ_02100 [Candidatus Coproplasma sp.]
MEMTDNFKVVKNKYIIMAVVAAVALGVFCGVITACSLLLAFKLSEIELLWVYYVLIGAAVAACCAVPFYFLLRPNDRKLAAKLDKQYSLNQKVQTMVEFAGAEGAMVTLQREQTNEALAVAAKARPDFKGLIKFVFIPVMAVAIACVSIIIPAKKTTVVQPGFTLTDVQRKAVDNLIEDVNSSKLSQGLKVATTTALSELVVKLEDVNLLSRMKSTVISSINGIDTIIAGTNSYLPLYKTLKEEELTKPFAVSVAQAVANYKYTSSTLIKTLGGVEEQHELYGDQIKDRLVEWKEGVIDTFYHTDEESNSERLFEKQEIVERIQAYSAAFKEELAKVTFVGENDLLLTATADFAEDILTINSNYGAESYLAELGAKCESFITPSVEDSLYTQLYSCLMDEFIRNRTAEIFGLKVSEIGSNSTVVPDHIESGSSGGGGGSGDWGDIKPEYGSNDKVLDPDTGEFVEYGTLLESYRNKINERIAYFEELVNDENATDEQKAEAKYVLGELSRYVRQYLDRLEGSAKE